MTPLSPRERGRKGGRATLAKYGHAHFQALGKLGFAALARKLGYVGGSRRQALARLVAAGKLRLPGPPAPTPEEVEDLYQAIARGDYGGDRPTATDDEPPS
ncbi:MAG: hypothetical protein JOZ53_04540 [Planctomycetaceae bacterium]|nr:hypothetical protein [Planctomycetaceae bacterium]